MANYSTLKAAVADVVKTNGTQAITGANLQAVLLSIINSVGGGGYIFAGVATPSTDAGTPDENVFYIGGAGTYANFGTSVTVPVGSICVFKYNGSWTKEQIALFAGIDDVPTANSNNLVKSGGVSDFHFNKVQLGVAAQGNDWSKVITNVYVKNWTGGSKRLLLYQCYRNNSTYGSGIAIHICDADFSNRALAVLWSGTILGNVGQHTTGLQVLFEQDIAANGVTYGKLSIEVNWDAIPDGFNAVISPFYYLNIKSNQWQPYTDAHITSITNTFNGEISKINDTLLYHAPFLGRSLPMVKSSSNLAWIHDCSPTTFANFLIDFKLIGTPQSGYEYCLRGFNYKNGTEGVTSYYCWFNIAKKNISTGEYSNLFVLSTPALEAGFKTYSKSDLLYYTDDYITNCKVAVNWDALARLSAESYTWLTDYGYEYDQDYIFDLTTGYFAEQAKYEEIKDDITYKEITNITPSSPYFVSSIFDAFISVSSKTIVHNEYTSTYGLYLFRLPAGDYQFEATGEGVASIVAIGTIASESDFVLGGMLSDVILAAGQVATEVRIFSTMTYVVLQTNSVNAGFNCCGKIGEIEYIDIKDYIDEHIVHDVPRMELTIPDTVYAVVGTQLNIWNDAVSLSSDRGLASPLNYQIRWQCSKGLITDRCFRYTPEAEDAGNTYSCSCFIYDINNNFITSKTFNIKVLAKNALQTSKNIAYFGDSLGASAAAKLYLDFSNTDKFTGTAPTMRGTRGTTYHYDAVGGYRWEDYATAGRDGYRAYVSNVSSISIGAVYTDGQANFEVIEVNIVNGTGNILLTSHYTHHGTLTMPSGTLTKISGGGDNTIPYTGAFQESANPLWNDTTQQLDISQYKSLVGMQSTDKFDAVSFQFGINDNWLATNTGLLMTYIHDLYHCFVDDNPNCKFIIGLTTTAGNDLNGSGANYGATWNWYSYLNNVYKLRQFYLTLQNSTDYPNIRISAVGLEVDRYYGYAFSTREISQRYTETEQYHNNYVHPSDSGYGQMGDAYFATYIGVLTE